MGFGEIGRLPSLFKKPKYCGCKKEIEKCQIWKPILHEVKTQKWSEKKWNDYLLNFLFQKSEIIIDSSGNLSRLKQLKKESNRLGFNLKLIYLYRSPFGVIYSMSKKGNARGEKRNFFRATLSWIIRNWQMRKYFEKVNVPKFEVSYDEFCESPDSITKGIWNFLGVSTMDFNNLNWHEIDHHAYAGNKGLRESQLTTIKRDVKWKEGLSKWEINFITVLLHLFGLKRVIVKS
jgi:hypothetical protein